MTQDKRPAQDPSLQPAQSPQADSLVASYQAAQQTLDAEASETGKSVGGTQAGPSAQTRANILAYAAQQPHVRTQDASADKQNATDNIAARAVNTAQTGQFSNKKPSANDSQWKLRALASVAVFGISGLLFMQWDRAAPEEKDQAFSAARPAPAVRPKAPATDAQASAQAGSAPSYAASPSTSTTEPAALDASKETKDLASPPKPAQSAAQLAKKTAPPAAQQSPPLKAPVVKRPNQEPADNPVAGAPQQPSNSAQAESKLAVPQPNSQARNSVDVAPNPAPAAALARSAPPAPSAPLAPSTPPAPAAESAAAANGDAAFSKSAPSGTAMQSAPAAAARSTARAKSTDAERPTSAGATLSAASTTALFAAIRAKDLTALQQALADGADKNAKSGGTPAITLCAQLGQADMVRALATAGADVNATDAQGISALDHARGRGFSAVMDILQKYGAR